MHYNQKLLENLNRNGHLLLKSHESHPHVPVKTYGGNKINIKQSQALTLHKQHATAHIKATGSYSNILDGGGSVDIPIRAGSGFGHVNNAILKFVLQNSNWFIS